MDKLPYEILLDIFEYMDIPDVDACKRTCRTFRTIALDKRIVYTRLHKTAKWLDCKYPERPNQFDLYNQRILLSPFQLSPESKPQHLQLIRTVNLALRKDTLRRGLEKRPTKNELVVKGVVDNGKYECPRVAAKRRELEKNRKKDKLERFFESNQRPTLERAIELGVVKKDQLDDEQKNVRNLTRMFSYWIKVKKSDNKKKDNRIIEKIQNRSESPPTRAMVHKMKQQFEEESSKSRSTTEKSSSSVYYSSIIDQKTLKLKKQYTGITFGAVDSLRQHFIHLSA